MKTTIGGKTYWEAYPELRYDSIFAIPKEKILIL
jgi:hypothetical protein